MFVEARLERRGTPCRDQLSTTCGGGETVRRRHNLENKPFRPSCDPRCAPWTSNVYDSPSTTTMVGPSGWLLRIFRVDVTSEETTLMNETASRNDGFKDRIESIYCLNPCCVLLLVISRLCPLVPPGYVMLVQGSWRHPPSRPARLGSPACLHARQRATGEWPLLWLLRLS